MHPTGLPTCGRGGAGSVALRGMTAQCYGRSEFNAKLASAAVNTVCPKDCSHIVDDQLPARFPGPFEGTIKHAPLVLYGWSGCRNEGRKGERTSAGHHQYVLGVCGGCCL
eukprot:SAG25_NODE_2538_length_1544_cov_1.505190_2_plen_109_part_01